MIWDYQSQQLQVPNFGIREFAYELYPNKIFIILSEHDHYAIATKILASYSTDDLINALSIAYIRLPADQQYYVTKAFENTQTLPFNFHTAVAIAATRADEDQDDPTLNSLKNLLVLAYGQMTQDEIQSRYYHGLNTIEQQAFQDRWGNYVNWYNQNKSQPKVKKEGSGFWSGLAIVLVGIVAGYAMYRTATYNNRVNFQYMVLQNQNTQIKWQLDSIQHDLRRLAY